jgi:hypothetical protein
MCDGLVHPGEYRRVMLGDAELGIASGQFFRGKAAMTYRAADGLGDRVCRLVIGDGFGSG